MRSLIKKIGVEKSSKKKEIKPRAGGERLLGTKIIAFTLQ